MSNGGLPVVFVLGGSGRDLRSAGPVPDTETQELECHHLPDDSGLPELLARIRPQAIVSFGSAERYPVLNGLPYSLRRCWINIEDASAEDAGERALYCFLDDALRERPADSAPPLVSVFTPVYRPGDLISRPFRSLLGQSHPDWEWVILDDSDDDDVTWRKLNALADSDCRISLYRQRRRSGNIGELKNKLGHLCQGEFLVELDHDDELTPDALRWVVDAFGRFPQAGFAYSDCAEVFESGANASYPPGWAFGYGTTRPDRCPTVNGPRDLLVHEAPPVNSKTIRHIVSTPNHLRAWRRSFYRSIGGHNRKLHVADDFELCVRSFLHTRMVRIAALGYLQYYNASGNTQRLRNKEIQRLVRRITGHYDRAIHDRLLELGLDDFCWTDGGYSDLAVANPEPSFTDRANLVYDPAAPADSEDGAGEGPARRTAPRIRPGGVRAARQKLTLKTLND